MATYFLRQLVQAGFRLVGGETLSKGVAEPQWSTYTGIVALASGGQTGATPLLGTVNSVDTVANANDSVALPAATGLGRPIVVINTTASTSMQVFGSGTDTINGVATGTGVAQAAGKTAVYISAVPGAWYRLLSA